eukprot:NODE_80_length_22759_cov_1.466858.p14 type:complete len:170 gc:universal NODE_80_length_22759_cov_1.466858:15328-15837(+)
MTRSNLVPDYVKADFYEKSLGIGYLTSKIHKKAITGLNDDDNVILVHQTIIVSYFYAGSLVLDMSKIIASLEDLLLNDDSGFLGYSINFKPLQSAYESITFWNSVDSIRSFFTGGIHLKIMEKWKDSLIVGQNILTARFEISSKDIPEDSNSSTIEFWTKVKNRDFKVL